MTTTTIVIIIIAIIIVIITVVIVINCSIVEQSILLRSLSIEFLSNCISDMVLPKVRQSVADDPEKPTKDSM
jgi:hypothetical protein